MHVSSRYFPRRNPRSFSRALNTCDFDVPSAMPSMSADFLVIEPFDVVQHERLAAPFRQPLDGALEIEPRDRRLAARGRLERRFGVERFGQLVHLRLPAAHEIEAVVERQTVEPRAERRVALEAAELAVGLQEDFLEQVFAVVGRPGHPAGQRVDLRAVLPVERLERVDVSRLDSCNKIHRHVLRREGDRRALLWGGHVSRYEEKRASGFRRFSVQRAAPGCQRTRSSSRTREPDTTMPSATSSDRFSTSLPP